MPKPDNKDNHEVLLTWREAAGLSQDELAARLGRSGSYVCRKEQGKRVLHAKEVTLWGRACGMSDQVIERAVLRMAGLR